MTELNVQVPRSIEHLDWDPDAQPEEPKTCTLFRFHPSDKHGEHGRELCGRKAAYLITVHKPCGHKEGTIYLCVGCWNEVEANPARTWQCLTNDCHSRFCVRDAITSWTKLPQ